MLSKKPTRVWFTPRMDRLKVIGDLYHTLSGSHAKYSCEVLIASYAHLYEVSVTLHALMYSMEFLVSQSLVI